MDSVIDEVLEEASLHKDENRLRPFNSQYAKQPLKVAELTVNQVSQTTLAKKPSNERLLMNVGAKYEPLMQTGTIPNNVLANYVSHSLLG